MKLWGGRFEHAPAEQFEAFSRSIDFDRRLVFADLEGTIAWARALERVGIYSAEETPQLCRALKSIATEVAENPAVLNDAPDEDIHTWVIRRVTEVAGDAIAGKLHTGRSRNEQVSLDLRIWLKQEAQAACSALEALMKALVTQAERFPDLVVPGYTHLRRAQPVLWAHYLLAYFEMFRRDRRRLQQARDAADEMPLGSGALAGSGLPIDRLELAGELGFSRITANSLDVAGDRDFALEFLFAASTTFLHLSRLAEDWILYSSEEFGFLELSDAVTSGSSLMPQKKNPDSLELIRGKTGRVLGHLLSLATIMKGLPLTYNRDLQEDKELVFDAADQLRGALEIAAIVVSTAEPHPARMRAAAAGGWSCATDLAEYLAQRGVAFREAHEAVGRIVRAGIAENRPSEQWTLKQLRSFHNAFAADVLQLLQGTEGIKRREVPGGTGPTAVDAALAVARRQLAAWASPDAETAEESAEGEAGAAEEPLSEKNDAGAGSPGTATP